MEPLFFFQNLACVRPDEQHPCIDGLSVFFQLFASPPPPPHPESGLLMPLFISPSLEPANATTLSYSAHLSCLRPVGSVGHKSKKLKDGVEERTN